MQQLVFSDPIPLSQTIRGGYLNLYFRRAPKRPSLTRFILVAVLCIQVGLPPAVLQALERKASTHLPSKIPLAASPHDLGAIRDEIKELTLDPKLEGIAKLPNPPLERPAPSDPIVDHDPFFMRSQRWVPAPSVEATSDPNSPDFVFEKDGSSLALQLAGTDKRLQLRQPLHPFYSSSKYVFLAADAGSRIFSERASGLGPGETPGEGFFLIAREEFETSLDNGNPVALYFLPLPGSGWVGNVRAAETPGSDIIVFQANNGDTLPYLDRDLDIGVNAQRGNYFLAIGMVIRHEAHRLASGEISVPEHLKFERLVGLSPNDPTGGLNTVSGLVGDIFAAYGIDKALPPVGSTAGFGILFTGHDLEQPERTLPMPGEKSASRWREVLGRYALQWFSIPSAHAEGEALKALTQVIDRGWWVLGVLGVTASVSLVFKYSLPGLRKKFAPANASASARGLGPRLLQELKDYLGVYASALTVTATAPYVWLRDSLDAVLDRYAPRFMKGENSLIRRILNGSVGYSANAMSNLLVNWWTTVAGIFVIGTIDAGFVPVQLLWFIPVVNTFLSSFAPDWLAARIKASQVSDSLKTFIILEILRNIIVYITRGPSSFSGDMSEQTEFAVQRQVQLERLHKHFQTAEEEEAWLKQRKDELRALKLQRAGLPLYEDFNFDCQTITYLVRRMMGYFAPDEPYPGPGRDNPYAGARNPGLIQPAIRDAIALRKRRLKDNPEDLDSKKALELLNQAWWDSKIVLRLADRGASAVARAFTGGDAKQSIGSIRRLRQILFSLTDEATTRELPEEWGKVYGEKAARLAALDFQDAFFALKRGDKTLLKGRPARREEESAREASSSDPFARIASERQYLRELRQKKLDDKAHRNRSVDPFVRSQLSRARGKASQIFYQRFGHSFYREGITEEKKKFWDESFRECVLRQAGILPDWDVSMSDEPNAPSLRQMLEEEVSTRVNSSPYAADPATREERAALYATEAYLSLTADSPTLSPLSPAQPGITQRIRQWKYLRNPIWGTGILASMATRLLRFADATTSPTNRRLGRWNAFGRNVPFLGDSISAVWRTLKIAPTYATAVFLTNYFLWKNKMSYAAFTLLLFGAIPVIKLSTSFLSRAFENNGWRPMGNIWKMAAFAAIFSWLTCVGYFPITWFEGDWKQAYSETVGQVVDVDGTLKKVDETCSEAIAGAKRKLLD